MKRRVVVLLAVLGAAAARRALAQPAVRRIGLLAPGTVADPSRYPEPLLQGLHELGWVEGRNLRIERRIAADRVERLPAMAEELVALDIELVVTVGTPAALAARKASGRVPIVMATIGDPVATGLVDSLARPGGNVSGVLIAPDGTLAAKKMEPLREAVPRAVRVGFLSPEDPAMQGQIAEARRAAAALGQEAVVVTVRSGDHAAALSTLVAEHAQTLLVGAHTSFMTERRPIIERALRHKLPTMWEWAEQVRDGGLMAYSTSLNGLYDRVAGYIDRVFRGAGAGDLPIEQPPTFGLVLNQGAAHAIGLSLPRPLLLRAEEVIE
jgi:putative ABC transport system substrate-binding protein